MGIKRQNTIKADGGMSSMTDLVFLLLIFFVILSTMASTGIQVDTPKSSGSSNQPTNEAVVSIKVENGIHRVYVGKKEFTYVNRETNEIDLARLALELEPLLGENQAVELKAAKDAQYEYPAQIINLVKQKKWKIVLIFRNA